MKTQYWIVKQEPEGYSWDDFSRDGRTTWEGVRNYQARNNLKAMKPGDRVLFYASSDVKSVVGIAEVTRSAFPDTTADEPGWVAVELKAVKALARPVPLAEIKANKALSGIALVRHGRLSVGPLDRPEFERIVGMGSQTSPH
jgi:predicted RNA-binding protein with PUA-like domain